MKHIGFLLLYFAFGSRVIGDTVSCEANDLRTLMVRLNQLRTDTDYFMKEVTEKSKDIFGRVIDIDISIGQITRNQADLEKAFKEIAEEVTVLNSTSGDTKDDLNEIKFNLLRFKEEINETKLFALDTKAEVNGLANLTANIKEEITVIKQLINHIEDEINTTTHVPDGSWSDWESWSACSDSCGGGVKTRERSCTTPHTSRQGKPCTGSSVQSSSCNRNVCPDDKVAFMAYDPSIGISRDLIFSTIKVNEGNGYDNTTGRFTCVVPGLYFFSVTLTKHVKTLSDRVECILYVNSTAKAGFYENPVEANDEAGYSSTMLGVFHLQRNDYVRIGRCFGVDTIALDIWSSFIGFLITADNRVEGYKAEFGNQSPISSI